MRPEVSVFLDLLRLVAGMAVFLGHSYIYTGEQWARPVSGFATDAVAVFFVISGFVIAFVASSRETTPRQYAVARLARLYSVVIPAIIVTLACDAIGTFYSGHWYLGRSWFNPDTSFTDALRYLTFSNELWNSHIIFGSDEPYWSIGFEASYYAIYAAMAFRYGRRLINVAATVLLLAIAGPKIASFMPLWLIGVAVFHLVKQNLNNPSRLVSPRWCLVLCLIPVAYALLRLAAHLHPDWKTNMFEPFALSRLYLIQVAYYTMVGLLTGLSIIAVANSASLFSALSRYAGPSIRWLAGGTFSLYLLHQPILLMLASIFANVPESIGRAIAIQLLTLVAVYAIAEITERRKRFSRAAVDGAFNLVSTRRKTASQA